MAELANDMGVARSSIHLEIHENIGQKTFVLTNCPLLTSRVKTVLKLERHGSVNDTGHLNYGPMRSVLDEKHFIQDRKANHREIRLHCQALSKLATVMHISFPLPALVPGVIGNEEDAEPFNLLEMERSSSGGVYVHGLDTVVKTCIENTASGKTMRFGRPKYPLPRKENLKYGYIQTAPPLII